MATYKERLEWLIKRGFVGVGKHDEVPDCPIFWTNATELALPYEVETVEEAIDMAIEEGVAGTNE